MNLLVALFMLVTLLSIATKLAREGGTRAADWLSLALAAGAIGVALARTVRNAVALGAGGGTPAERSRLARSIFRDHLFCFVSFTIVVVVQVAG
jgi:hypothetical protein